MTPRWNYTSARYSMSRGNGEKKSLRNGLKYWLANKKKEEDRSKKKKKSLSHFHSCYSCVMCSFTPLPRLLCIAFSHRVTLFFFSCILSISVKLPVKPLKLREWWKWEKVRGKRVRNWDQKERPGKNTGGKKRERERERDKKMKVIKKNKTSKNIKAHILYSGCYGDHKFQKR